MNAGAAAVLHSMSSTAKTMASREELQNDVDASKPRPKANLDASEVKDVYTIETLVGPDVMRSVSVKEWQEAMAESRNIESKSRYVAKVFPKVAKEGDVKKLKVLRYLSLLLEFHLALGKQSREGRKLPKREDLKKVLGVQDNLVDRIVKKFGDGGYSPTLYFSNLVLSRYMSLTWRTLGDL
jgi:DNA-directed RNA polymerase I subunit RPA49